MRERNAEFHSKQHRAQITRRAQRVDAVGFFNLLTGPELLEVTESHLPEHRERLYPQETTYDGFRLVFGAVITVALGLAALMAKGVHWM